MSQKILIVDDETDVVAPLKFSLEAQGFTVLTSFNGVDALETARKESPDLILLDLMMPKLDGYKVCRLLKFDARYKGIMVLILSARGQQEDIELASACGADAYLTKPFDPQRLFEELKRLLQEAKRVKNLMCVRRSNREARDLLQE